MNQIENQSSAPQSTSTETATVSSSRQEKLDALINENKQALQEETPAAVNEQVETPEDKKPITTQKRKDFEAAARKERRLREEREALKAEKKTIEEERKLRTQLEVDKERAVKDTLNYLKEQGIENPYEYITQLYLQPDIVKKKQEEKQAEKELMDRIKKLEEDRKIQEQQAQKQTEEAGKKHFYTSVSSLLNSEDFPIISKLNRDKIMSEVYELMEADFNSYVAKNGKSPEFNNDYFKNAVKAVELLYEEELKPVLSKPAAQESNNSTKQEETAPVIATQTKQTLQEANADRVEQLLQQRKAKASAKPKSLNATLQAPSRSGKLNKKELLEQIIEDNRRSMLMRS